MEEEKFVEKIIRKICDIFCKRSNEEKKQISNSAKAEMCRKSIQSGVCPHACDRCAWNVN